jgi:hypothetical protein
LLDLLFPGCKTNLLIAQLAENRAQIIGIHAQMPASLPKAGRTARLLELNAA